MKKQMLGPSDIARRWGVNRATVIRLIEEKSLPALVVRKTATRTTYRVKLADLEEYEKSRSTMPRDDSDVDDEAPTVGMLAEVVSS